jgi:hypothetical protein
LKPCLKYVDPPSLQIRMTALAMITPADQSSYAPKKGVLGEKKTTLAYMKRQAGSGSVAIHSLVGNILPRAQF